LHLLIDIGNTNLRWASLDAGRVGEMRTVRHHGALPIDLHAAWEALETPEQVLVGNVGGGAVAEALVRACRSRWGREPTFARTARHSHGVTVAYERPERFGVDRWLALLAAHQVSAGPALVVDAGTAVTFDLLLADGRHLGGLIVPGIGMMRDSLLSRTAIPSVEPEETDGPWTADTASAIAAGSIQAPAALADRLCERLAEKSATVPELVVTGGDAERLLSANGRTAVHVPDLVLRGLALLA
jgi:type III pantothenate kinase